MHCSQIPTSYRAIIDELFNSLLQETFGLDDEVICELDGYMGLAKYGSNCMENDRAIETEFGLRRLGSPFLEQTQEKKMFQ